MRDYLPMTLPALGEARECQTLIDTKPTKKKISELKDDFTKFIDLRSASI